ncbi:hypothetical protein E1263_33940 [Kribbella antibiotica]|uniref:Uncharacterized protein n=1 Tax=Kribbella antibiotica TaxID=190195 RepID=A0A4R4YTN6_9ACTN|nr:hypothetical protein [Kribbella antibiotica]TDD47794.1 hypothetical protein E1263_33940 [Kribbella antibiotica]
MANDDLNRRIRAQKPRFVAVAAVVVIVVVGGVVGVRALRSGDDFSARPSNGKPKSSSRVMRTT